jgi:hypothetical protein
MARGRGAERSPDGQFAIGNLQFSILSPPREEEIEEKTDCKLTIAN